jgi:hypothetical protein
MVWARVALEDGKASVASILTTALSIHDDPLVREALDEVKSMEPFTQSAAVRMQMPRGTLMSRDLAATNEGLAAPAHIASGAKKGVGVWTFGGVSQALAESGASWYYTWSTQHSGVTTPASGSFVPMIWGAKSVTDASLAQARAYGPYLLGFNEPDMAQQSNMTVEQALELWPQLMAAGKILPYLDIPLQHAAARILRLMKRPASSEKVLTRIRRWRELCPGITLRSTFIAGFPGETETEFAELLAFLEEAQLDRVGCFAYSPVEGAAANALPDPVPEPLKEERRRRFMQTQARISAAKLGAKVGNTLRVLIDEPGVGRTQGDAPEIDGVVHFKGGKPGEFADVLIERADEHDLYGRRL